MGKLVIVFLIALGIGYSYGYREAVRHSPSAMERVMRRFGVYKVQADQERRERNVDAVTR
jgi:N-acyl-L-homoserine lactone synthetase